ncbi:4'-phosphopantetheinyl transferase family protein [Leucobacter japonicus]|uniref:4'-phosphopantetheinyl transferase family protein n=1 Tax=Leucobacter japonicus TaxID=1461259 RepID=UPI0006A7E105|nr:4'-phosphopantetheinyl transferase superfamily protein [Leucobacter japonicus]
MIELLSARVDDVLAGAEACASAQDHRAAARRRTPELQRRTLAGRAALRLLAARCLGVSTDNAGELPIDRTCLDCDEPHGRPTMSGLALSSSTSGDHVLVAVAADDEASAHPVDLGVDVEVIPHQLWPGFDEYALHPSERDRVPGFDSLAGIAARVRLWTQKEAVLKATGDGLRVSPATVHCGAASRVGARPTTPWRRAQGVGEGSSAADIRSISVRTLMLGDDTRAAVATSGFQHCRLWTLEQLAPPTPSFSSTST